METVRLLLTKGANINSKTCVSTDSLSTLLCVRVLSVLLARYMWFKALPATHIWTPSTPSTDTNINTCILHLQEGMRSIHLAISGGHVETATVLMEYGGNPKETPPVRDTVCALSLYQHFLSNESSNLILSYLILSYLAVCVICSWQRHIDSANMIPIITADTHTYLHHVCTISIARAPSLQLWVRDMLRWQVFSWTLELISSNSHW